VSEEVKSNVKGGLKNKTKRQKLIAVNFKMNLDHLEMTRYVQKLHWLLQDANHDYGSVQVVLLAPFTDLRSMQVLIQSDKMPLLYGAQDISMHDEGPYTGEISGKQLKKLGCSYTLVTHTERRNYHFEDDVVMMRKATKALKNGIKPIICLGEQDEEPRTEPNFEFLYSQLQPVIDKINSIGKKDVIPFLENVVIAYEPRWAVSNGHNCAPNFTNEVFTGLRKKIIEEIGEEMAYKVRLVYGGSVNLQNIGDYVIQDEIDGVLIGKAALDVENFAKMVRVTSKVIKTSKRVNK
jgi:triosephosphate isomerase